MSESGAGWNDNVARSMYEINISSMKLAERIDSLNAAKGKPLRDARRIALFDTLLKHCAIVDSFANTLAEYKRLCVQKANVAANSPD